MLAPTEGPGAPIVSEVRDRYLTRECRIIDEIVENNEGQVIELKYVGALQVTREIDLWIKVRLHQRTYPQTADSELDNIFTVENGRVVCLIDTAGTGVQTIRL